MAIGDCESASSPNRLRRAADWAKLLAPTGAETRLGQALRQLIQTSGARRSRASSSSATAARTPASRPRPRSNWPDEAKIPVFTVGLGSDRQPTNVAVCDLAVPARAYPGDHYTVTGYVQAQGMAGKVVTVQLLSRPAGDDARRRTAGHRRRDREPANHPRRRRRGAAGEVRADARRARPPDACAFASSRRRATATWPTTSARPTSKSSTARTTSCCWPAGRCGNISSCATNCIRDHSTTVDVLLQSGQPGMSQEANKILDDFPATREEMYDYDCVVAFDPNWQALSAGAGGTAGKMGRRAGRRADRRRRAGLRRPGRRRLGARPRHDADPQSVPGRVSRPAGGHGEQHVCRPRSPGRWSFTREGLEADFLWLADTATASRQAWAEFPGVYSYCPVRGPKPGATVFARFSDPRAAPGRPAAGLLRRAVLRRRAACSTWAAARCGGSARSTRPTSSSSTPS